MNLKPGSRIYFMGIGGTGMAAVAGLCQEAGFDVSGSDAGIYPPMSTMLDDLKIPVMTPYSPSNVDKIKPDCVVVANVLSKGHPEIEKAALDAIPFTSFPALMGEAFLRNSCSLVVAGTHGKTTTSTMTAFLLKELGHNPGYLIGGSPKDLPRSFSLGKSQQNGFFVIEGDEYDTAFFDKDSKFLHYCPKYLILNNLEFDHADIFENLEAIERQFTKLIALVKSPKNIIANVSDEGIFKLLKSLNMLDRVTRVATDTSQKGDVSLTHFGHTEEQWWADVQTPNLGNFRFSTMMEGGHNLANFTQVIALLDCLIRDEEIPSIDSETLVGIIARFRGVARRLDKLADKNGITVYEDFAHHPTAVQKVLQSYRLSHPERRLVVAFEPRNATARRSIFMKKFADSLGVADQVWIGECPQDSRILPENRMDTKKLCDAVGANAQAFASNEDLLDYACKHLKKGDAIIFMSSGSFSGVQHKLKNHILSRN